MSRKTFVEAYRAGEVEIENVHDYVEYWHTHDTGNDLYQFLGMTKTQFSDWIKRSDDALPYILNDEVEPIEIPVCKICGAKMGVETAIGILMKSNYQENGICHDCQVDHCCSTNCLGCTLYKYPDCPYIEMKKIYMEDDD